MFHISPDKTASRRFDPNGVYFGEVKRIDANNMAWVEIPRLVPGFEFGPVNVAGAPLPRAGDRVGCVFVENHANDIVVIGVLQDSSSGTLLPFTQCTSTTRPAAPREGELIWETNTDQLRVWTGAAWLPVSVNFAVDDVTIEVSAGAIRVKDGGIGPAKLAAGVAGDGLTHSTTTGLAVNAGTGLEISGDAVRIAAAAAGNGLTGGGGSALGVNTGTGLEISGDAVQIAAAAAGNGLSGGGGSPLAVNTGTGLEISAGTVRIAAAAAGDGLTGGGGSALAVNPDNSTIEIATDQVRVKDEGITEAKLSLAVPRSGFRNYAMNGNFIVNQRGATSVTTSAAFLFDRWRLGTNIGTATLSAQSFGATVAEAGYEAQSYARLVTNNDHSSSGSFALLYHDIEGVRTLAGKVIVVSFWARSPTAGTKISPELWQQFGVGGSAPVSTPSPSVISLTTAWVRYSRTFTVPTAAGKTITADNYTRLHLWVSAGATYAARSTNIGFQNNRTVEVWGVQIERGVLTPFEDRPVSVELPMCQRYYERVPFVMNDNLGGFYGNFFYLAQKRVAPNLAWLGANTATFNYPPLNSRAVNFGTADGYVTLKSSGATVNLDVTIEANADYTT